MGSYLALKIEVKTKYISEVLELIRLPIAATYNFGETTELICGIEYMGYAEPLELYKSLGDMVIDIHWIDITCATCNHEGRNARLIAYSCKKESKKK